MTNRRLATRLVVLAAIQVFLLALTAVAIFWATGPHHHHHPPAGMGSAHFDPRFDPNFAPRPDTIPWGPLVTLAACAFILIGGAVLTARWIVRPIEKLSKATRAIGEGDLTVRTGVERSDEIGELGEDIDEMAQRIDRLVTAERELLANVAHELRTPLSRIGVALDLAGEGDATRARASLEDIAVDVDELETIVNDILTAARMDLGKPELPLHRAHVEPSSIAKTAADRLAARHPDRPLVIEIAHELPEIDVDPMMFRRVVDNLLENAHKYTPDGSSPIKLAVSIDRADVVFEVIDRGVGIPAEDLPLVFTPFFRGERSRSRETGGVGLGLTLARRIADAHGGTVSLTSKLGVGTTARLTVPRLG